MKVLLLLVFAVVTVSAIPRPIREEEELIKDKRQLFDQLLDLLERRVLDNKGNDALKLEVHERTCTDFTGTISDEKLNCVQAAQAGWCMKYNVVPDNCCQSCSDHSLTQYCTPNPCGNGGSCVYGAPKVGYTCNCATGFSGDNCEWTGTCSDSAGSIGSEKLSCAEAAQAGWCKKYTSIPDTCCHSCSDHTLTKYCEPNPCQHGGVCSYVDNLAKGYSCQCTDDYKGANCELNTCSDSATMDITLTDAEGVKHHYDCAGLAGAYPQYCASNQNIGEKCCASCSGV